LGANGWEEWRTFDGTPVLVPEGFNTTLEENGDLLIYPEGDKSAPASGRMPKDGYYFDAITAWISASIASMVCLSYQHGK